MVSHDESQRLKVVTATVPNTGVQGNWYEKQSRAGAPLNKVLLARSAEQPLLGMLLMCD